MTFAFSIAYYGRFVTLVINDITEYLGIACFTVKKKDEKGEWKDATKEKKQ
jgi:ethanolaminephosphotransferase